MLSGGHDGGISSASPDSRARKAPRWPPRPCPAARSRSRTRRATWRGPRRRTTVKPLAAAAPRRPSRRHRGRRERPRSAGLGLRRDCGPRGRPVPAGRTSMSSSWGLGYEARSARRVWPPRVVPVSGSDSSSAAANGCPVTSLHISPFNPLARRPSCRGEQLRHPGRRSSTTGATSRCCGQRARRHLTDQLRRRDRGRRGGLRPAGGAGFSRRRRSSGRFIKARAPHARRVDDSQDRVPPEALGPTCPPPRRGARSVERSRVSVELAVTFDARENGQGMRQQGCVQCGIASPGAVSAPELSRHDVPASRLGSMGWRCLPLGRGRARRDRGWNPPRPLSPPARRRPRRRAGLVTARVLILAAGTLGTTEILLRSRRRPARPVRLAGAGLLGEWNYLGFADYQYAEPATSPRPLGGHRATAPPWWATVGTAIQGAIDFRLPGLSMHRRVMFEDLGDSSAHAPGVALLMLAYESGDDPARLRARLGVGRAPTRRRRDRGAGPTTTASRATPR